MTKNKPKLPIENDNIDQKTETENLSKAKKKFWNSSKLMSFIAILLSAGTMFTITYQNHLIRKQQHASVLPYLMISYYTGQRIDGNLMDCRIDIYNNGIGPAFIDKTEFLYNGQRYTNLQDFFINELNSPFPNTSYSVNTNISEGFVLPAGQGYPVIASNDSASARVLEGVHRNLQIKITYSSVYEESWEASDDKNHPIKIE